MKIAGTFNLLLSGLVMVFFLCVGAGYGHDSELPIKLLWQKEFIQDSNKHYELGSATINKPDNRLIVMVGAFSQLKAPRDYPGVDDEKLREIDEHCPWEDDGKPWLWEIDFEGNHRRNVILENAPEVSWSRMDSDFRDIETCWNGGFIVLGIDRLLKVDPNGNTSIIKTIQEFTMLDICRSDDHYFVVGYNSSRPFAIELNSQLAEVTTQTYDITEKKSGFFFTQCIPNKSKRGFIGTGMSSRSISFVLCADEHGKELSKALFDGYPPSSHGTRPQLCVLDSGIIIVSMGTYSDLQVTRAYSPDLELLWKKEYSDIKSTGSEFQLADINEKHFAIVGYKKVCSKNLSVYVYDDEGVEYGNKLIDFDEEIREANFQIVSDDDCLYVVAQSWKKGAPSKIIITALEIKTRDGR